MKIIVISNGSFLKTKHSLFGEDNKNIDVIHVDYNTDKGKVLETIDHEEKIICLCDCALRKSDLLDVVGKLPENSELTVFNKKDEKFMNLIKDGIKRYYVFDAKTDDRLFVKTFDQFDVYSHGQLVDFKRKKAKEILAILIDNKASTVTTEILANLIFEDGKYNRDRQKELHVYISDLRKTLKEAGHEKLIVKTSLGYAVNQEEIYCDYYEVLKGDKRISYSYAGKYMQQYSWAEATNSYIEKFIQDHFPRRGEHKR